ncbi:serine-rich protein [Neobacillus sp. YIM B02564]|uniref:Serine-rich protein n=1 Tax=Neobacillus paridis TaxID=2803862 RepID=A0ABS1TLD6_9BACI|nr:serine-rich protein [Neobacillus paridis]MBL4952131.1 serine-rich protein [Neobacillus paridis]
MSVLELLQQQGNKQDFHDMEVVHSNVEYSSSGSLNYLLFEMKTKDGNGDFVTLYKAIKLHRLIRVPKNAKQLKSLMDMQGDVITGLYRSDVNFVQIIANILRPKPIGLLFVYGIQSVSTESMEDAKRKADIDFSALTRVFGGTFRTMEMRVPTYEEMEWLRQKMHSMKHIQAVRGLPKPRKSAGDMNNSSGMGSTGNADSEEQTEEFIAGMTDFEYVALLMATPIEEEVLEKWLTATSKDQTRWEGLATGSKGLNFGLSLPMMYMANIGASEGWNSGFNQGISDSHSDSTSLTTSHGVTSGITHSAGTTVSDGVTVSDGISSNMGQSIGTSEGVSESDGTSTSHGTGTNMSTSETDTQGTSQTQTHGTSWSESDGTSRTVTDGTSHTVTDGTSTTTTTGKSHSVSDGTSHSTTKGTSTTTTDGTTKTTGTNWSESDSRSQTTGTSHSTSRGTSWSNSSSSSSTVSTGTSDSTNTSHSTGTNDTHSDSRGSGTSHSRGGSVSVNVGIPGVASGGGSYSENSGTSTSRGTSDSHGVSESTSTGSGHSTNASSSTSHSSSSSRGGSYGTTDTTSHSTTTGHTTSHGGSESTSKSHSVSKGVSNSVTSGTSHTVTNGTSSSVSHGTSHSVSQGASHSVSEGTSHTSTRGGSESTSIGASQSKSFGQSKGTSENWGTGTSQSFGRTQGSSLGDSFSEGANHSISNSHSVSGSQSVSKSLSESDSVSKGKSHSDGWGTSKGQSQGFSGAVNSGAAGTMGIGPSVSWSKTYQWKDIEVQNIIQLLDFQRNRLFTATNGQGAFYVDFFIATENEKAKSAATALATSAWMNDAALVSPLQVLSLDPHEEKHLLYHMNAFSPCLTKEGIPGQLESYKFSTVLLADELAAFSHPPRISEGGLYAEVDDMPVLAVPSNRQDGEIYVGNILSGERYSPERGYETEFQFRIRSDEIMHAFFQGGSRSGKTVAATRVIAELANNVRRGPYKKRMRIIAMDPKKDWRILSRFVEPERFRFYSLADPSFCPIKLNLARIPKGVYTERYMNSIVEVFCRSYGLGERGKQILTRAFYEEYTKAGCFQGDGKKFANERSANVTLATIYRNLEAKRQEMDDPKAKVKYGNDARDAFTRVMDRMESFGRVGAINYQMFCNEGGMSIDELLGADDVVVLESYGLESTTRSFVFGLVTSAIYQYCVHNGGFVKPREQYETILVIEEANEVLIGQDSSSGDGNGGGLSGPSEFERILDQAAGNGLFIWAITQKISMLPTSIIANCGLVFGGRTKIPDDINVVVRQIGREERYDDRPLVKFFPRCPTGWFAIQTSRTFDFKDAEPAWVKVERLAIDPPEDDQLQLLVELGELERAKKKMLNH